MGTAGEGRTHRDGGGRRVAAIALLGLAAVAALAAAPLAGQKFPGWDAIVSPESGDAEATIFWDIRVPRVLLAFIAGCGLAVSGMVFQAMFRNPLATPFTLGVASGASLGAALSMRAGVAFAIPGISEHAPGAFAGACAAIALVYGIARLRQGLSTTSMLLAGVAVSFFFSSLILFVQYESDLYSSFRLVRWLMGGLEYGGYADVLNVLIFVGAGSLALLALVHEINLLATGEDLATSRGVDVPRAKLILFFATSLMVGGIVAVCGPIGFVGMMVPHTCRLIVGGDHRFLFPATLLVGGTFLTVCDTIARVAIAPAQLPVGVITAFLGGPFFLWLLLARGGRYL